LLKEDLNHMSGAVPPADQAPSLARVARGDLCAGCGLCAGLAPAKVRMTAESGYLRPVQVAPLTPAEDSLVARVCPGLGQQVTPGTRTDSALWGPYERMWTGWATDPRVRFAASSGGVLSMMLIHLLETGRVDAVVQTEASPELPIANVTVVSRSEAAVVAAAGSRYAPSAPLADLASHLATGLRYAFVGKPCDVAALRALAQQDPKVAAAFPVMLSFFCAGVPSLAGGRAVLQALGAPLEQTRAFRFRGNGWPGQATAVLEDGSERSMSYHDSWGKILSKHVQHRCKICADGTGTAADIVCGDAWESDEAGYPVFEEADGVSLIVARTALGQELLSAAANSGRIVMDSFDVAGLAAIQPGQRERRRALFARLAALRLVGRPVPRYVGLKLRAAARQNSVSKNARNFLGMLRRALR
jgi:coenzyme F420 hydrogenase subunit beta